jgi:hypothetical protein
LPNPSDVNLEHRSMMFAAPRTAARSMPVPGSAIRQEAKMLEVAAMASGTAANREAGSPARTAPIVA